MTQNETSGTGAILSRRAFTALAGGTGLVGLAGCGDSDDEDSSAADGAGTDSSATDDLEPASPAADGEDHEPGVVVRASDEMLPGRTVEFQVAAAGEPVEGAAVLLENRSVGVTDADGRIPIDVPGRDEFTLEVVTNSYGRVERTVDPLSMGGGWYYQVGWFDTTRVGVPTEDVRYNPHASVGRTHARRGLFEPYAGYDHQRREFLPALFEHWEHRDGRMVVSLRDDVTWTNGDAVDASAVVFQWEILLNTAHPAADVVTDVAATGEFEVAFSYEPGTDPRIVDHAVLHERADHPREDWQSVHDGRLEPAELTIDEPTSSGPLTVTDRTDDYVEYAVRDHVLWAADHPAGEHFNWNGYRVHRYEDATRAQGAVVTMEVDGTHSLYADDLVQSRFPDTVEEIRHPSASGMGLWFDHTEEPFDRREVRQAVAHSIDFEEVIDSVGESWKLHHPAQTGLTVAAAERCLGGTNPDGFGTYEQDDATVEALLDEAGRSLDEIELKFVAPKERPTWVLMASSIADQLLRTGWTVSLDLVDGPYSRTRADVDFDLLAMAYSDHPRHNHPYFSLRWQLLDRPGHPAELAGYAGPDDVDLEGTLDALATAEDDEARQSLVRELATVVNRDLPYVQVAQGVEQYFLDREYWLFPEDSRHLHTDSPLWWLPTVEAARENAWDDEPPGLLKALDRVGY